MSTNSPQQSGNNKLTVIIVALLVLIAAIAYWVIDIKYKEIEINNGFSQQALRNPYLAAELFITELNPQQADPSSIFETQRGLDRIKQLPATQDTLIITSARNTVTDQQSQALLNWVEQGGHLIIKASKLYNSELKTSGDDILDPLEIRLHTYTTPEQPDNKEQEQAQDNSLEDLATTIGEQYEKMNSEHLSCVDAQDANLSPFPTEPTQSDAQAHIQSPNILEYDDLDNAAFWSSDGYGPQLIQLSLGQGTLTVMTDMALWQNHNIGCFDNAYVLQLLINHHNNGESGKTWLLYHEQMPSFSSLLWQYHKTLIVSSIILLVIWLWSQTIRFGPIKIINSAVRRQFSEHLEASSRYRFKAGQGETIIDTLRQQILAQMILRHSNFEKLGQPQQIELITRLSETEPDQVYFALYQQSQSKPEQLIRQVQHLQKIRKQLC